MCLVDENRGDRQEKIVKRRSSGEDQQENSVYKQWSYLRGQHSVTKHPRARIHPLHLRLFGLLPPPSISILFNVSLCSLPL
ncbi:hypothetical protein K469DRAFT_233290 [Zopfia rhizophila CBS 207.26]|uniref:Uncharacterized protein n=1 Tax=Zopfia rhizophila CBS 207.26 TaxID=1314779 RepID=A0A6A6DUI9_9PEZI|nr:hypothetical protein K469DRAFT_233290 [Zopfia rhizophila CBS 207.26]